MIVKFLKEPHLIENTVFLKNFLNTGENHG